MFLLTKNQTERRKSPNSSLKTVLRLFVCAGNPLQLLESAIGWLREGGNLWERVLFEMN